MRKKIVFLFLVLMGSPLFAITKDELLADLSGKPFVKCLLGSPVLTGTEGGVINLYRVTYYKVIGSVGVATSCSFDVYKEGTVEESAYYRDGFAPKEMMSDNYEVEISTP